MLYDVLQSIWNEDEMPVDFCNALVITLYKNKGSKVDFGKCRSISMLSIAGKIFAHRLIQDNFMHCGANTNIQRVYIDV